MEEKESTDNYTETASLAALCNHIHTKTVSRC